MFKKHILFDNDRNTSLFIGQSMNCLNYDRKTCLFIGQYLNCFCGQCVTMRLRVTMHDLKQQVIHIAYWQRLNSAGSY